MSCSSCHKDPCGCSSNHGNENFLTEEVRYNGENFSCKSDKEISLSSGLTLSSIILTIYTKLCEFKASIVSLTGTVYNLINGHIIQDNSTDIIQRAKLSFQGNVNITDDAGNNRTIVEVLSGSTGAQGEQGFSLLHGVIVPGGGLGIDGDLYVNLASVNLDLYEKSGGVWTDTTLNMKGLQGSAGANGTNGINGTNGANGVDGLNIYQGVGAPASGLGFNGESYIDSTSGDLYHKISGFWIVTGNIYTGAIAGVEDLFAAQSTVIQSIVGNDSAQLVFSNDSTGGNFDYTNSWITNTWTASDTRTNISFGCVISLEVNGVDSTFENNVNFVIKKNGTAIFNGIISVPKGTSNGTIINETFNTIATNFVLGDIVTCEISTVGLGSMYGSFSGKVQIGSLFYNVQL